MPQAKNVQPLFLQFYILKSIVEKICIYPPLLIPFQLFFPPRHVIWPHNYFCETNLSAYPTLYKKIDFHLEGILVGVLADEEEENLEPVVVEVLRPLPLVKVDDPSSAGLIPRTNRLRSHRPPG